MFYAQAKEEYKGIMVYQTLSNFLEARITSHRFTITDPAVKKEIILHPIIKVDFEIPQIGRFSKFVVTDLEEYTMAHNDTIILKFYFSINEKEHKGLKDLGYSDQAIAEAINDLKHGFINGCINGINSSVTKILRIAPFVYVIDSILTPIVCVFNGVKSLLINLWKKL